jgi:hypothetical protein
MSSRLKDWQQYDFLSTKGKIGKEMANTIDIKKFMDLVDAMYCAQKYDTESVRQESEWYANVWRRVLQINDKLPSEHAGGWLFG